MNVVSCSSSILTKGVLKEPRLLLHVPNAYANHPGRSYFTPLSQYMHMNTSFYLLLPSNVPQKYPQEPNIGLCRQYGRA